MTSTTTRSPEAIARDEAIVADVAENLMTGRYFAMHAASDRSVFGYEPLITARDYGHVISTAGAMASDWGDLGAAVARSIVHKVNLYGTRSQVRAAVYDAIAEFVTKGYDDVIGRTGPEGGRYSDHHRSVTLGQAVGLAWWAAEMVAPIASGIPGVGWPIAQLSEPTAERPHSLRPRRLPALDASAARIEQIDARYKGRS